MDKTWLVLFAMRKRWIFDENLGQPSFNTKYLSLLLSTVKSHRSPANNDFFGRYLRLLRFTMNTKFFSTFFRIENTQKVFSRMSQVFYEVMNQLFVFAFLVEWCLRSSVIGAIDDMREYVGIDPWQVGICGDFSAPKNGVFTCHLTPSWWT